MYKTLLVHLDDSESCAPRVAAAIEFAQAHDAHLIGRYSLADYYTPVYADIPVPADIYEIQYQKAVAAAKENEQWFTKQLETAGCAGEWRSSEELGGEYPFVRDAANADLAVVSQSLTGSALEQDAGFAGRVVVRSPVPVLILPEQGAPRPIGRRVMIAWSDSREAARALGDALPLLKQAEHVVAATVTRTDEAGPAARGDQLQQYLGLHNVSAELDVCEGSNAEAGAKLLGRAAAADCDLIVAGAYGHSRLREAIFGGVTQHLIEHTTVPLLMSH